MEKIQSFIVDDNIRRLPFYVELAGITFPDANYSIYRDNSDIYVLEYIIDGCGTVEIDEQTFFPSKGDVYLLPYGSRHHYFASKEQPFTKIWMNVNGELCRQIIQLYGLTGAYFFENVNIYHLLKQFLELCENREYEIQDLYNKCGLIFFEIIQILSKHLEKKPAINKYAAYAKNFCDRNIYKKISLEDISKYTGISISQLNRLFRQEFGVTVYSYILNSKINLAKSLLSGTSMSVSEIAFLLNFADEHYFSNIFKKKTGFTPTFWRRRN